MGRQWSMVLAPLALLGGVPAFADTVHLTNGRSFEDVVAEQVGEQVVIQMPHGEMKLPASRVARIEKSDTLYASFLARKKALGLHATAASWLDLARWAREQGFEPGVREAARRTAELDPAIDGLAPYMRSLGYQAYDAEVGRWLTQAELMRRKGFELWGDEWVPRDEAERRDRARREEIEAQAAARRAAREDRLGRAVELLTLREIDRIASEQQQRQAAPAAPAYGFTYFLPGYPTAPVVVVTSRPDTPPAGPGAPPAPPTPPRASTEGEHRHQGMTFGYDALSSRQPGSILPLSVDPGPGG